MKKLSFIASVALASFALATAGAHAATDTAIADAGNAVTNAAGTNASTAVSNAAANKPVPGGAEVVRGLQSLTPDQLDKVLAQVDKFDDNTKRQFKDAVLHPSPFTTSLLVAAADRISPESRQQLADAIVKVKAKK